MHTLAPPLAIVGLARTGSSFVLDIFGHDPRRPTYLHEPLSGGAPTFCRRMWRYDNELQSVIFCQTVDAWFGWGLHKPSYDPMYDADFDLLYEYLRVLLCPGTCAKFIYLLFRTHWLLHCFPDIKVVILVRHPFSYAHSVTSDSRIGVGKGQGPSWVRDTFPVVESSPWFDEYSFEQRAGMDSCDKALAIWNGFYRYAITLVKGFSPRCVLLRYEDVCSAPEPTLRGLYNLLGEDLPDEIVHRFQGKSAARPDAWWGQEFKTYPVDYLRRGESYWPEKRDALGLTRTMQDYGY